MQLNTDQVTLYDSGSISIGIPNNTTIANALVYTFNTNQEYSSGVVYVTVVDAEGGVRVAVNDQELRVLKFDDTKTMTFSARIPKILNGTNKVQIWSSTGDGQTLKRVIVKAGVQQNVVRKDSVNKIIDKLQQLYSAYKSTKDGIGNLPSLPSKVLTKDTIQKSKIDQIKSVIDTLYNTTYTCHYYSEVIISDEVLNEYYNRIQSYIPIAYCYSCDYYSPCTCNGSCNSEIGCSCNNTCNGYSNCSCYNVCNSQSCRCNSKNYFTCECYSQLFAQLCRCDGTQYIVCECNNQCVVVKSCSCNHTCDSYIQCVCDFACDTVSCRCDYQCYKEASCKCDHTCDTVSGCMSYSTCACDVDTPYCSIDLCQCDGTGFYTCQCDGSCDRYSCDCYTGCDVYSSCTCDRRCYLQSYNCDCNLSCDGHRPCSCYNACDGYSCSCETSCYHETCECDGTTDALCMCNRQCNADKCKCNGFCFSHTCPCNSSCVNFSSCQCDYTCHGYNCGCESWYAFECWQCYSQNYTCSSFNYSCPCDSQCDTYTFDPIRQTCSQFTTCSTFATSCDYDIAGTPPSSCNEDVTEVTNRCSLYSNCASYSSATTNGVATTSSCTCNGTLNYSCKCYSTTDIQQ